MKPRLLLIAMIGIVLVPSTPAWAAGNGKAPATWKDDASSNYFGTTVPDPYRWLEFSGSPGVRRWIAAQNAHTDKVLASFPQSRIMADRVKQLALTSTRRSAPRLVGNTLFYLQQTPPQPHADLVMQPWPAGKARVLIKTGPGDTAITGYWPSPDGKYVAYGTASGGNEATTLHVFDVASGRALPYALPHAGGGTTPAGVMWDPDGKGFLYVLLPKPGRVPASEAQFNARLFRHIVGTPASKDTYAFGKDLSPVAEYDFARSADGRHAAILVHYGDGNADHVFLNTGGGWKEVAGPQVNIRAASSVSHGAAWQDGRLAVIFYGGAPRGRLLSLTPNNAKILVGEDDSWAMHSVAAIKGGFLITEVKGPDWRIVQYDSKGRFVRIVALPGSGIGIHSVTASTQSDEALIAWSGWTQPTRWSRYDAAKGALKTVFEVKSPADYSNLETYRLTATSRDGTKVPVTVIARAGVKPNGKRPTILYAYGGFGLVVAPHFLGPYLAWLEQGGVYAVANIRGGGAYGEGWHEHGMLADKQNGFDDFYAAAQALVDGLWTDAAHLGIEGASNGGLLMGAALTQHPREYRAVVSRVGIYDMLRAELWPNGRYNTSEYGTVTRKKDFQWLYAYSPLHHVKKGTDYPAVLLITAVNDARVAPWQSRKFAAALQAANASHNPILLLTRMDEGHGVTASFSQRVSNTAATLGFFAHELDLDVKPADRHK